MVKNLIKEIVAKNTVISYTTKTKFNNEQQFYASCAA